MRGVRIALLIFCAIVTAAALYTIPLNPSFAIAGQFARTGTPFVERVISAERDADARPGDLLDLRAASRWVRYRLLISMPDRTFIVPVRRGGRVVRTEFRPLVSEATPFHWMAWGGALWALLCAIFIAWRCPRKPDAQAFAFVLSLGCAAGTFHPLTLETPFVQADFFTTAVAYVLLALWYTLPAVYAANFAFSKRMGWTIAALAFVALLCGVVYSELALAGIWTGRFEFSGAFRLVGTLSATAGGPLLLLVAVFATKREHRARVAWLALALVPWQLAYTIASQIGGPWWHVGFSWALVGPLLLTYAILSRRTVDIGFVMNRAAVFSVISLLLLGVFVFVEWLLTDFLSASGRTANVAVTAVLAVVLGLSIRFIHARIERVVDRVFFARRHEAEQKIRAFAQDAPYVSDEALLLARAASVIEHATNAEFVEVLVQEGNRYTGIDENDPAIVRLRSTHRPVGLHGLSTAIRGEIAFPLPARGLLLGVLVLGPQSTGEAFPPDEREAIAALSYSVGSALDNLQARASSKNGAVHDGALEDALAGIRESIDALRVELRLGKATAVSEPP